MATKSTCYGTDPKDADTDDDGFNDDWRAQAGSDPTSAGSHPLPATGPTSAQLIDAALAAGSIDNEQALIYRMFAEFSDPRLPAEFVAALAQHRHAHRCGSRAGLAGSFRRRHGDPGAVLHPADLRRKLAELSSRRGGNPNALQRLRRRKARRGSPQPTAEPNACLRPILEGSYTVKITAHANIHYCLTARSPSSGHQRGPSRLRKWLRATSRRSTAWKPRSSVATRLRTRRFPSGCNGGDGALDITIVPNSAWRLTMATARPAQCRTVPYGQGCSPRLRTS